MARDDHDVGHVGRLAIAVALVVAACGGETSRTSTGTTTTTTTTTETAAPTDAPTCTTTSTTTTTVPTTTTTTPVVPLYQRGDEGPEVAALQQRLRDLGYWFIAVDAVDGTYDDSTAHAVTAFQKQNGLERDGVAGPLTLSVLDHASRPSATSTAGYVVEIDLTTQTLMLVQDGRVQWVFDVSTGARAGTTPRGHWHVFRHVDGYDRSPLGVLYRPKYFSGGVAVHGYPSVPPYPASHGCVRVINAAMDWLWSTGSLAIGTEVWVS